MNAVERPLQDHYWEFMRRRNEYLEDPTPALPWWMSRGDDPLNPTEAKVFEFVASAASVVDIGAGDGRIREKFRHAGFGYGRNISRPGQPCLARNREDAQLSGLVHFDRPPIDASGLMTTPDVPPSKIV